jgi:hypothetical protein
MTKDEQDKALNGHPTIQYSTTTGEASVYYIIHKQINETTVLYSQYNRDEEKLSLNMEYDIKEYFDSNISIDIKERLATPNEATMIKLIMIT